MNYEVRKIKKNNKGFTLLEMIVAMFLFTLIMLAATQIFQLVIEGQRNALASQDIQESMRYALEVMSKEIRMAKRSDGDCPANPPPLAVNRIFNFNTSDNEKILYFKNKDDECVSYYLGFCNPSSPDLNGLRIRRGALVNAACLTPSNIKVNSLKFTVIDNPIAGPLNSQPRVTISMDLEVMGKAMHKQNIKIQTTISSRYYE